MFRIAAVLALLLTCVPAAAQTTEPAGVFDQLFGARPEPMDASRADGPGRDDLAIVALFLGSSRIAESLAAHASPNGLCLSVAEVLDSLELAHEATPEGVVIQLTQPARTVRLAAADLVETPSGRCATLATLSQVLPASFRDDPGNLRVVIEAAEAFPIARRLEREEQRKQLMPSVGAGPPLPRLANPWGLISAPTVDMAANLGVNNGRMTARFGLDASADLLAMQARLRTVVEPGGAQTLRATLARTVGPDEAAGPLGIRRAEIGDIVVPAQPLVADAVSGRGLVVSSRPNWRADLFDEIDITGPMPAGWDAELYRDDRLMAVATKPDTDGNYRFAKVPLRAGTNRYVVKLFGPRGETAERVFVRVVGRELNPENETTYTVGIVEPGVPILGAPADIKAPLTVFATAEHGLGPALSTRLDVRVTGDELAASAALHASLLGGYGSIIAGHSSSGTAFALRAARRFGASDLTLTLADHGGRAGRDAPADMREFRRLARLQANSRFALGSQSVQVQLGLETAEDRSGTQLSTVDAGVGMALGRVRLSNQVAAEWRAGPSGANMRAQGTVAAVMPLGDWRLRSIADYRIAPQPFLDRALLSASRSSANSAFGFELGWDLSAAGPVIGVSASRYLGPVSLSVGASRTPSGWQAGLSIGLSLFRPGDAGYRIGPTGMSNGGSLQPMVFVDDDGDGIADPNEARVPGARFIVDNALRTEATTTAGSSLIDRLPAGRPVAVETQLSSLPDLSLRPVQTGFSVVLRPGQVMAVPVALRPTGEVEVRVLRQAGDEQNPLSGVLVVLSGGGQKLEVRSDFDGYASFDGVPFGTYTLSLPDIADSTPQEIKLDKGHRSVIGRRLLLPAPN